jgi:FAD/FMN-containing dehydrogenase
MTSKISAEARKGLEAVVGRGAVSDDPEVLRGYSGCLGPMKPGEPGKPLLVVKPRNTGEVQMIVRLANQLGLNLIPASSGTPRFRGSTVPAGEGVIVDLSGMDNIIRINGLHKSPSSNRE